MKKRELFTIGYQGRELDEFVDLLKQHQITRLIDIREAPISRKKGFAKNALRERLAQEKIDYVHIRALGSPPALRDQVRSDGDYDAFFKDFTKHLDSNMEAVKEAHQYLSDGKNCLMCFELSYTQCHRSAVAEKIKSLHGKPLTITHI
jgi:uncharacterized protein (DUF488 family)